MPFKAKNNREAVVVWAIHVVKRPSKRSVLVYNKQRNNSSNQGLCFGNFPSLKSQDCLPKVKAELKSKRFFNFYMEDVTATQQYFRYLLPESPLPGYVQYFVQDPFIIHMYSYKELEILKLMNSKDNVLNLDATGSLISKPPSCFKKIFTMPHNTTPGVFHQYHPIR